MKTSSKICILKNKEWDESGGKRGLKKEFISVAEAEFYIKNRLKLNPGRLSFTKVQLWRKWSEISEEDFLSNKYKAGSRVAMYTNGGFRVEVFKAGEEIVDTLPEIIKIRDKDPNKPLDLSDLRKRKPDSKKAIENLEKERIKILNTYAEIYPEFERVRYKDLIDVGINKSSIKALFSNIDEIDSESRREFPNKFKDVRLNSIYGKKYMKDLRSTIKDKSITRFIITTAVTGCDVDENFLASIKTYCKEKNAMLLVMLSTDPASKRAKSSSKIDRLLEDEYIVFEEMFLNKKLILCGVKTSAKMINPTTGLSRVSRRTQSMIVASPKQNLEVIPTGDEKYTHVQMTTGAITKPDYETDKFWSERTAYIAYHDHMMGGIVVEIENNKIFHYRQIQVDSQGRFADLGVMYTPEGSTIFPPSAIVAPDWHTGDTDPSVKKAIIDASKTMGVKEIILHDFFNGKSINHHERDKKVRRAIQMIKNNLTLENELISTVKELNSICKAYDKVVMVKSNHDEWLDRYVESGIWIQESQNSLICCDLFKSMFQGKDPLRSGLEKLGLKSPEKIKWLKRDESYKVANIETGVHGDRGIHGRYGSLPQMEIAYGDGVFAHTHVPRILRGAWSVGTATYLRVGYNIGASGWMNTFCIIYSNGARQLINVISKKWRKK